MKKFIVATILMGILLFSNSILFAQKQPPKHKKEARTHKVQKHNKRVSNVRMLNYPRNRVVVVKKRQYRTIAALPVGHTTISFRGRNYFYDAGFYYNYIGNTYSLIAPPMGIRIKILPPNHHKIFINRVPHFYYMGAYYKQIGDEYEIVEPAVGTVVPELPADDVDEVTIDGLAFYEYDNVLYKSVVTESGVQYEVAGKVNP